MNKTIYESLNITSEHDKYDIRDMITGKLEEFFDNSDIFLQFEHIENPLNTDATINAMLMLQPYSKGSILAASEHDCIYFSVDIVEMAKHVDETYLIDLSRCGVRWEDDSFQMFT
jgi:hypothetical protein